MLGITIIVFREALEAALLIGIVAASTRAIAERGRWISGGIALGLAGACMVAALTAEISGLFEGVGQELFNAVILGVAVLLLAWHCIWMTAHSRELAIAAREVGQAVHAGRRTLPAILLVIAIAVLREGAESALFVYGLLSGMEVSTVELASSVAAGGLAASALGWMLYGGMLRLPMKWFFTITNALLLVLAAGMASRMAQSLVQANLIPALKTPLWDSSPVLPVNSTAGAFLHALAGYEATPSGMQVVFYVATLVIIIMGMRRMQRHTPQP